MFQTRKKLSQTKMISTIALVLGLLLPLCLASPHLPSTWNQFPASAGSSQRSGRTFKRDAASLLSTPSFLEEEDVCPLPLGKVSLSNLLQSPEMQSAVAEFNAAAEVWRTATGTASLSVAVTYGQDTLHTAFLGSTDANQTAAPTLSTVYRLASVTKVFTALVALRLERNGRVNLDRTVQSYLQNFSVRSPLQISNEPLPPLPPITLRQLMDHTSGLQREWPCGLVCTENTRTMLARIAQTRLLFPPGQKVSYSNLGIALLGRTLEFATGTAYEQLVEELVLEPLGLSQTSFMPQQTTCVANAFNTPLISLGWGAPAGQLFSSLKDQIKLLKALSPSSPSQGLARHLGAASDSWLQPTHLNPHSDSGFGAPWEIFHTNGHVHYSKIGNMEGYNSDFARTPYLDLGIAVLTNGAPSDPSFVTTLALSSIGAALETALQNSATQARLTLQSPLSVYTGEFQGLGTSLVVQGDENAPGAGLVLWQFGLPMFEALPTSQNHVFLMRPRYFDFDPPIVLTRGCVIRQIQALEQYVVFGNFQNNTATTLEIPGLYYDTPFVRV